MVVGAIASRTELAIVGGGPGGYVAALRAADAGIDVTLIEREALGGTCLNVGCIPSKTLIEVANIRHHAHGATAKGLDATVEVRVDAVADHLDRVSRRLRGGVSGLLAEAGVAVITGDASFARNDRLSIASGDQGSHLEFDNAIIATGSRPIALEAFPFGDRIMSSTGALSLRSMPETMAIIGAGYIGIELGTAWAKLGAQVTIIEAAESILPAVATELRLPVARHLDSLGIRTILGTTAVEPTAAGLILSSGQEVAADIVVVAVGRRPNSDQAGVDRLGIETAPSGHLVVDQQMRAGFGLYAIGDLVAGPALAHKATAEAEVAVDAILGRPTLFAPAAIAEVIYSDPEIMSVGVDLATAEQHGHQIHRFHHAASARAQTIGDNTGSTYLVCDSAGTVLGVHAVGPHVSELAGEAAVAIELAATIEDLALTIHPHPTMSESIVEAAWIARGHPLHVRR